MHRKQIPYMMILSRCLWGILLVPACALGQALVYPETKKLPVTETYFGTEVADPYRWLEDDYATETKNWVAEQNRLTFSYLDLIPYRQKLKTRITELYNYPRMSAPYRAGEYYFYSRNDGLQPQSVYYYQKGLEGTPQVFIDPNQMDEQGTTSVLLEGFSKDRRFVAYSVSESGSDWRRIYVKEVASGKLLEDELKWIKFTAAAWYKDGFFYSGYQQPEKGQELSGQNRFHRLYYHRLGTPQSEDMVVWDNRDHPLRYVWAEVTEDERYLIVYLSEGTDGTEVWYMDLRNKHGGFRRLFEGFQYNYNVLDNEGDQFLVHTNFGAERYRVVRVDPGKSPLQLVDIIPEGRDLLQSVAVAGGKLLATYLKDASSRVVQYSRSGILERELKLPAIGTVSGFVGEPDDTVLFYSLTSFTTPSTIYRYSLKTGSSTVFKKPEVVFNPDDYVTKQVFYRSKDGTQVPMFIVHKKGLRRDGKNPTLLYGYGGFNIAITPSFSPSRMALLEQGVVYAVANLRGGSEYGEQWHRAGMLLNKQKVFDDFIAAAEYLINEKYTSPSLLAIHGRSNGGLLVGAVANQRPDLFQVALPGVGVMDMLRFHKFTVGWGWVVEYGSSEDSVHFSNLYSYSPYHNIKPGMCYPATLVTTADHDDRVVPAHSFKYIARLQEAQGCDRPVLIRVDIRAGHGGGRPVAKVIEEDTDIYAFMLWNMGLKRLPIR